MKHYDYKLAKKIINFFNKLDVLESAYLGMHHDWFWTAEVIWENGEWKKELDENIDEIFNEYNEKRESGNLPCLINGNLNPEFVKYNNYLISGLYQSLYDTPVLELILKDDSTKVFYCYKQKEGYEVSEKEKSKKLDNMTQGVFSKEIKDQRLEIIIERWKIYKN